MVIWYIWGLEIRQSSFRVSVYSNSKGAPAGQILLRQDTSDSSHWKNIWYFVSNGQNVLPPSVQLISTRKKNVNKAYFAVAVCLCSALQLSENMRKITPVKSEQIHQFRLASKYLYNIMKKSSLNPYHISQKSQLSRLKVKNLAFYPEGFKYYTT